jgi:hypothetical protein
MRCVRACVGKKSHDRGKEGENGVEWSKVEGEGEGGDGLMQLRSRIAAHLLQILTAAPRAHGSGVVLVEDLVWSPLVLAAGPHGCAGRLPRRHLGPWEEEGVRGFIVSGAGGIAVDGRRRGG